jgi:hypothetical protein
MRTWPRLVGLRLHTLVVKAGKGCSGSPNASKLSGCTWYSKLACGCDGSLLVKAPNWLGAMLMGPLRVSKYSRPMRDLTHQLLANTLSVGAPCIL